MDLSNNRLTPNLFTISFPTMTTAEVYPSKLDLSHLNFEAVIQAGAQAIFGEGSLCGVGDGVNGPGPVVAVVRVDLTPVMAGKRGRENQWKNPWGKPRENH